MELKNLMAQTNYRLGIATAHYLTDEEQKCLDNLVQLRELLNEQTELEARDACRSAESSELKK